MLSIKNPSMDTYLKIKWLECNDVALPSEIQHLLKESSFLLLIHCQEHTVMIHLVKTYTVEAAVYVVIPVLDLRMKDLQVA